MALLYLAVLVVFGWLMISRRLTATIALPSAALCLGLLAVLPQACGILPAVEEGETQLEAGVLPALNTLVNVVIEPGVKLLSMWILAVIFGAVLAAQMKLTGAAERLVRYAAEYAGEDRFRLGLLMLCVISVLFTTLGGLGAVILVASICLPLMFNLGFEPRVAGALFLLGLSLGGCLNPVNWAAYQNILQLPVEEIVPFGVALALVFFVVAVAFLFFYVGRGQWRRQLIPFSILLAVATSLGLAIKFIDGFWHVLLSTLSWVLLALIGLLLLVLVLRLVLLAIHRKEQARNWLTEPGNWLTALSVLVPLLLLVWSAVFASLAARQEQAASISIPILTALAAGIVFCALASYTSRAGTINRTMRALFDGVTSAGPAVVLLIGIGLLVTATRLPQIKECFHPWVAQLPVSTPVGFVIVFLLLSPLALYRGPLNLYGMGSGIMDIFAAAKVLQPVMIMSAFFSVGMLQGVCDPTNTHNVWLANFCKVPIMDLTRITLPWVLAIVLGGLIISTLMF